MSAAYEKVLRQVDNLNLTEMLQVLAELPRRLDHAPRRSLPDFYRPDEPLRKPQEDWVKKLREEWD